MDTLNSGVVPARELVTLCASNTELYCRTFFPQVVRQKSPIFHSDLFSLFDSPARHLAIEVFRGGAKTTLMRLIISKRIAYRISRTIMLVGISQDHSKYSLRWIKRQIQFNHQWATLFRLRKGEKWTDELIEIHHEAYDEPLTVIASGVTGQLRGVNIDDYRPDFIGVDDPCNEENTGTPEQRQKISNLFFGALEKSLAPESESPDAQMVLLQTSLDREDLINTCHKDSTWNSRQYSCFDERGKSRWEERYPTDGLLADKQAHIDRNQLSLWLREMECTVISPETATFKPDWLQYTEVTPERMVIVIGIDPVPPPSENALKKALKGDFEVLSVVGSFKGKFYLLEYAMSRGHEPEWTIANFFRLLDKWRPLKVVIEGVAYQRTLKWIIEQAMKKKKRYVQIDVQDDKRSKAQRIQQAFAGVASAKQFFIESGMHEFNTQFVSYPNVKNDDVLDATAMALEALIELTVLSEDEDDDYDVPLSGGNSFKDLRELSP